MKAFGSGQSAQQKQPNFHKPNRVTSKAQHQTAQPLVHEQGALDPTALTQRQRQTVLARLGQRFSQAQRGRHGALLDRRGQTQDLVELLLYTLHI